MSTRIVVADGVYDLSGIKNLKDLNEEIDFLTASLKKEGQQLENQLITLPKKLVKSATENLLPSFLNSLIANGTWKVLLSGLAMFANPFSRKMSVKKNIVSSAKRLGLIALVKSAYSIWSSKRNTKPKPVIVAKKSPDVTTLKTNNPK